MDYSTNGSSLSMSGGDDFTSINEVLDRTVLLDTTQTIRSAKTFADGYTQQFDEGLEVADGKNITGDGLLNLNGITGTTIEVNGVDKIVAGTTTTTLTNTNIGLNGILTQTGSATLTGATITLQDATPTTHFSQTSTTTTLTNTNIATNGILTQTGNFTAKGATITLQDTTPTTKYLQDSTTTTITNKYIVSNATTEQRIQVNGGDKFISIVGSTSIEDVIMGVSSTSGGLFLSSTSGKITMDTNSTTTDGILIRNKNTGAGGVRIESEGTTGTLVLDSAGTLNANTNAGKNSLSSTTGQIELKTGASTNTGINIENTNATDGGITLKTNGTTGDIIITSGDNINLTASGTGGDVLITSSSSSTAGIKLSNLGTGGISILSSTTSPLTMGTGTTDYATVSSAGVGATQYWVGSGGASSFPLIYPVYWFSTQTAGQTTSQMRVGSFANNDTAETFLRYRLPFKSTVRSILLLSDDETLNANTTYIHISITNTTGLDTTPNYAYWIYNAGAGNTGNIVVTDNGSMTNVADIPANTTFYVYLAFGSSGTTINSVGTARTVPSEFQVHLYLQQVI